MTGLKSNVFINALIIFGAAGLIYIIGAIFYLLILGILESLLS